ncbi:MAG TPA: hypothetical protein VK629_13180, partial [Steroidobacteraceae bacterium]|nr:hypothetical protein [Steroidobacteraceae bacterium]
DVWRPLQLTDASIGPNRSRTWPPQDSPFITTRFARRMVWQPTAFAEHHSAYSDMKGISAAMDRELWSAARGIPEYSDPSVALARG